MYDDYYYGYNQPTNSGYLELLSAGVIIALIFIFILSYVVSSVGLMRLFKKAGIEGWKAWVPFYNTWIFLQLGGQEGWKMIFSFIPYVGIISYVFMVISANEINKKLGKDSAFTILFVLLPPVWLLVVGLDSSKWNDSLGKTSLAEGTILGYKTETIYVKEDEASPEEKAE